MNYDVISSDGRILNSEPLSYRDATLFSLDADIDSEDTSTVVPSTRTPTSRWGVAHVAALAILGIVAASIAAAIAWAWR